MCEIVVPSRDSNDPLVKCCKESPANQCYQQLAMVALHGLITRVLR